MQESKIFSTYRNLLITSSTTDKDSLRIAFPTIYCYSKKRIFFRMCLNKHFSNKYQIVKECIKLSLLYNYLRPMIITKDYLFQNSKINSKLIQN